MANKKKELKRKLFKCGTEAISAATGNQINLYYCPICGNAFSEEGLDNKTLTLEHIPPQAQGGKGIALTCVECNNTAGRTVDIAVLNRNHLEGLRSLNTKEEHFSTRVRMNFGHKDLEAVNYELSIKDGAVRFYPVQKANRPDYADNMAYFIRQLNQTPDEKRRPWQMTTRKRFNPIHAKVGDLRSAFLVCFTMFGYNFAFDNALIPVRKQIINYDEQILDYYCISLDPELEPSFKLGIVTSPFTALFCQMQNYGIFLPWINSPNDFYIYLKDNCLEKNKVKFDWKPIPWPRRFEAKLDFLNNKRK